MVRFLFFAVCGVIWCDGWWCIRCHGADYLVMLLVVLSVVTNSCSDKGF